MSGGAPPIPPEDLKDFAAEIEDLAAAERGLKEVLERDPDSDRPLRSEERRAFSVYVRAAEKVSQAAFAAAEREGLDAALETGIAGLTADERRWIAEDPKRREDLARRVYTARRDLLVRVYEGYEGDGELSGTALETVRQEWARTVDDLAARDTPDGRAVSRALHAFWAAMLEGWQDGPPGAHPEESGVRAALAGKGPFPSFLSAITATDYEIGSEGFHAEIDGTALWPTVREAWRAEVWTRERQARGLRAFRAPVGIMVGDGALAPLFGRKLVGKLNAVKQGARIASLRLEADRTQLELLAPNRLHLTDPSQEAIFRAFGSVLGNREWRTLLACFYAAHEDTESGRASDGKFWATPGRFAEILGVPREGQGRDKLARYSRPHIRAIDESLANLGRVKGEAVIKLRGKEHTLRFADLVRDDGVTVEEGAGPKRKRGRPAATLYRLNEGLREITASWFVMFPKVALAAPVDRSTGKPVRQDVWDDAVKILSLLLGHARTNAYRAKAEDPLPWARKVSELLADANLAGPEVPVRKVRARGLERLENLRSAGFVRWEIDGDGPGAMLRYDLPGERATLAAIPTGKRLPGQEEDQADRPAP